MRWTPGSRGNIQDLRGRSGGGMGVPLGIGGVLILLVGSWLTGVNLFDVVGGSGATDVVAERPVNASPEEERLVDLVDAVMGDIQHTWSQKISDYQPTRAVLFRDAIQSACGLSSAATGPFYCPNDRKVYLDLSFFDDLHRKLGAPGDFAQAYVLAHEVGHHVQNLTGTLESAPFRGNRTAIGASRAAGRCYAGVWGRRVEAGRYAGRVELDPGDVEEGLNAAAAIGRPAAADVEGARCAESFTHGLPRARVVVQTRHDTGDLARAIRSPIPIGSK
jgi:predicted metalloprotease